MLFGSPTETLRVFQFAFLLSGGVPAEAFSEMSPTLVSLLSNRLILGGVLAVITEQLLI